MLIPPYDDRVRLRQFTEQDLPLLDRLGTDIEAMGHFEWSGFRDPRYWRRQWEQDGFIGRDRTVLAVQSADETVAGVVSWRPQPRGAQRDAVLEIGCALLPEHRGQGLGAATQRLLVDHLFGYTTVHRIEARTDVDNIAEQKSLGRIGFQLEGVIRESEFQHGGWRSHHLYALLRPEWEHRSV